MRISARQIFVEVSPTRFELAVFERGVLTGLRTGRPSTEPEFGDWRQTLVSLEAVLPGWVEELGIANGHATVVYTGPETAASIYECPVNAGSRRARLAARLAMADTVSFPLEQNIHNEECVFSDSGASDGTAPALRTLAVADTESTIAGLARAVEQGGLKPTRFVPAPGASLVAAINEWNDGAAQGPQPVALWVGEHASVIAAGENGRLAFARLIPVGIETLVEALARPVTAADRSSSPQVDRHQARQLIFASGIPTLDSWRDSTTSLEARDVLPLIQPALQRLAVEIKQSIRFGLAREARDNASLEVFGPGSHIAGLAESICTGTFLTPSARSTSPSAATERVTGDIASVLMLGDKAVALTPTDVATKQSIHSMRRAVCVGAALGMLVIGIDVAGTWDQLKETKSTLDQIRIDQPTGDSLAQRTVQSALAARVGVSLAEEQQLRQFGQETPHGQVLMAISQLTPDAIKLTEITLSSDDAATRCSLRGRVFGDAEMSDSARFGEYTAALAACPLVIDTRLGETRRTTDGQGRTLSFSMTLELVELPVGSVRAAAQSEGDPTQ